MKKTHLRATYIFLFIIVLVVLWNLFLGNSETTQRKNNANESSIKESANSNLKILRFGHNSAENSAQHIAALEFARRVEEKSQGQIKIEVFPSQELGTDSHMIEMLRNGELDISLPPTAKLSSLSAQVQLFDSPFLFKGKQDAYEVLDGPLGEAIFTQLKTIGLVCPAAWESGFKHFTSNTPIRTPDDFNDIKVRVMKSPLIMNQFSTLGAKPLAIDFFKTREALKDGVVSAQENPLGSIYNMGFHEVQKYLILSRHAYLAQLVCFSQKTLDKLSPQHKEMLKKIAKNTSAFQRQESQRLEDEYLNKIKAHGTSVIELTASEIQQFKNATQHLVFDYLSLIDDKNKALAFQILKINSSNETIVIGLDADLSLGSAPAGIAIKRGIQLAIDEINERGGVLGKKLALQTQDHQGIAQRGIENIKTLAANPHVVAIIGGLHSPVALSELKIIEQEKIPFLIPWAAASKIVDNGMKPNWVYRLSIKDSHVSDFLINEALKTSKKIGLLLENTGWGRGNDKAARYSLAKHNLEPMGVEWFNWGAKDFTSQLNKLESQGTELIILVANAPEGIELIKNLAKYKKQFKIISHWGITGGYFAERVGDLDDQMDISFVQTYSFMNSDNDKNKDMIKKYLKKYSKNSVRDIIAPTGTAHAYDLTHLLAIAIEKANSLDRAKIREALENLPMYEGLVKTYDPAFTVDRHEALNADDFQLARFALDGTIVPIVSK